MKLFFEITSGDRQGSRFEIRDGVSVGRKGTDVVIRDSKISSRHAYVEERDHGYYLVDAGSSNGLKIEGNKVGEVHLLPGVSIQLGRTFLTVIDLDEVGETPEKPVVRTWQETVSQIVQRVETTFAKSGAPERLRMFVQPVELSIIAGPQTGQSWTIVYGPREVGAESLDLRLLEEGIPANAFELLQTSSGVMIRSQHSDKILVNGVASKNGSQLNEKINDGDEIAIQNTRLRVKLRDF